MLNPPHLHLRSRRPAARACATVVASAALLATAPVASFAAASAPAAATPSSSGVHAAAGQLIPAGPLATRHIDADANYAGVGYDGKGTFVLQTNALGNVSYYDAAWKKTVCGIKRFELYYDSAGSDGIPVDNAGIFIEQYQLTYHQGGRRYTVRVIDSAQIGLMTDMEGNQYDVAIFRERVKVRRQAKGARWCAGVHKKAFIGYRITHGA